MLWAPRVHDTQQVAGKRYDLDRFAGILEGDVTVRVRVLVGTDGASEEMRERLPLGLLLPWVPQRSVILVERPADHRHAVISLWKTSSFAHGNFYGAHGLENGSREAAADERKPNFLGDRWVKQVSVQAPRHFELPEILLRLDPLRPSTEHTPFRTVFARPRNEEALRLQPRKGFGQRVADLDPNISGIAFSALLRGGFGHHLGDEVSRLKLIWLLLEPLTHQEEELGRKLLWFEGKNGGRIGDRGMEFLHAAITILKFILSNGEFLSSPMEIHSKRMAPFQVAAVL